MFGVDLPRYSGRWYEIARSPFNYESFLVSSSSDQEPSFSVECEAATADYETVETPDGLGLRIINRCLNSQGQEISRATGVASPISDRSLGALLRVKFDSFMATTPNGKSILLPTSADLGERLELSLIHI